MKEQAYQKKLISNRRWKKANKEKISAQSRRYYEKNCEKIRADRRKYYQKNKEKINGYSCEYYHKNKESITMKKREYDKKNIEKRRAYSRKYERQRRKTNPQLRLSSNISCLVRNSLRGNKNGCHWEDLVGYTLKQLIIHLTKQFTEGMSWENYGRAGWTIDHIIPVAAFNFTTTEHRDFKRCWALLNLQPMWDKDNSSKRDNLTKPFQPSLLL